MESLSGEPLTLDEAEVFIGRVLASRWFGHRCKERPTVEVVYQNTDRGTYCDPVGEAVGFAWRPPARWRDQYWALHMLCHFLIPQPHAYHGPEFAHTLILAVGRFMGADAEKALRAAFRTEKVKTYTWSPEAKKKASERAQDRRFRASGEALKKLAASLEEDW